MEKLTVEKKMTGTSAGWWITNGSTPMRFYTTKKAAEADLAVAQAFPAMARAIVAVKYTYLDMMVERAAADALRARQDLIEKLRREAEDAEKDVERLVEGGVPWFSPGQYTRNAVELDVLHTQLRDKTEAFERLCRVVKHDAPTSEAAIALGLALFFSGTVLR